MKFLSYIPFLRPLFPGTILLSLKKVVSVRKENKQLQSCQEDGCTAIRSPGVFFLDVLSEMWVFGCDDFLSVLHHETQLTQNVITTVVLMSVTQGAVTLSLHKF